MACQPVICIIRLLWTEVGIRMFQLESILASLWVPSLRSDVGDQVTKGMICSFKTWKDIILNFYLSLILYYIKLYLYYNIILYYIILFYIILYYIILYYIILFWILLYHILYSNGRSFPHLWGILGKNQTRKKHFARGKLDQRWDSNGKEMKGDIL